jgi:hypothetical protein
VQKIKVERIKKWTRDKKEVEDNEKKRYAEKNNNRKEKQQQDSYVSVLSSLVCRKSHFIFLLIHLPKIAQNKKTYTIESNSRFYTKPLTTTKATQRRARTWDDDRIHGLCRRETGGKNETSAELRNPLNQLPTSTDAAL